MVKRYATSLTATLALGIHVTISDRNLVTHNLPPTIKMKTITIEEQCQACNGSGLYIGMVERDGAAIVCCKCKGSGRYVFTHTYEDFVNRKEPKTTVKRVFQANPGIVIGENNGTRLSDFGGMPYKEWVAKLPFLPGMEDRKHTCPAWWCQVTDASKKPNWASCNNVLGRPFSSCSCFINKHACWELWGKENR